MRANISWCQSVVLHWRINLPCWANIGSTIPARSIMNFSAWRPFWNTGPGQKSSLNNNENTGTSVTDQLWFSTRYQRENAELSQWLQSALERLEFWNTQAILVPQELETVRDHLSAFLVTTSSSVKFIYLAVYTLDRYLGLQKTCV